jgi:hypothetical protein
MSEKVIIGRLEYVSFPDWNIPRVRAKIDTGARTSALHVENIQWLGHDRIRFDVVLSRKYAHKRVPVETRIKRISHVRPTTGQRQKRYVVTTTMRIGPVQKRIELNLVDRQHMTTRMLLGRTALNGDFLVDPALKDLVSRRRLRKGTGERGRSQASLPDTVPRGGGKK